MRSPKRSQRRRDINLQMTKEVLIESQDEKEILQIIARRSKRKKNLRNPRSTKVVIVRQNDQVAKIRKKIKNVRSRDTMNQGIKTGDGRGHEVILRKIVKDLDLGEEIVIIHRESMNYIEKKSYGFIKLNFY